MVQQDRIFNRVFQGRMLQKWTSQQVFLAIKLHFILAA
jgi:hypothetical protein